MPEKRPPHFGMSSCWRYRLADFPAASLRLVNIGSIPRHVSFIPVRSLKYPNADNQAPSAFLRSILSMKAIRFIR